MILRELKSFLQQRRQASLKEIATYFDTDEQSVAGMLDFWLRKGQLRRLPNTSGCAGSCSCSHKDDSDLYQWNPQLGGIAIDLPESSPRQPDNS